MLQRAWNKLLLASISFQSSCQQAVGWSTSGRPYTKLSHTPSARRVLHTHTHTHCVIMLNINKPSHMWWQYVGVVFPWNWCKSALWWADKLRAEFTCIQMSAADVYFLRFGLMLSWEPPYVVEYSSLYITGATTQLLYKIKSRLCHLWASVAHLAIRSAKISFYKQARGHSKLEQLFGSFLHVSRRTKI